MFGGLCHFGSWGAWSGMGAWGWVWMVLQFVFWGALLAGIVALVVWAIRQFGRASNPALARTASGGPSAKEILQARYARGEITREQYRQMLEDLS